MLNIYYENNVKISRADTKRTVQTVMPVVHNILKQVHKYDSRFKIQPLNTGSYYSHLKVAKSDEFDYSVILEIQPPEFEQSIPPAQFEQPIPPAQFEQSIPPSEFEQSNLFREFLRRTLTSTVVPGTYTQPRPSETSVYERPPSNPHNTGISTSNVSQCPYSQQSTSTGSSTWQTSCEAVDALLADGGRFPPPPVGQCFLLTDIANILLAYWASRGLNKGEACLTSGDVVLPIKVKRRFRSLVIKAIQELDYQNCVHMVPMSDSPAITLTLVNIPGINYDVNIDLCPLVESKSPFAENYKLPRPGAGWPTQEIAKRAMACGVNVIAKHPLYWAISFSESEKVLLEGIDKNGTCRKKSARILKRIREQFLCRGIKPVLTSYHLKNILFWECE